MNGRLTILVFTFMYLAASKKTAALSEQVDVKREQEHKLVQKLFKHYQPRFLPRVNGSEAVRVQFAFELINIKDVNAKNQFLSVYGWVRQKWFNPFLQWNASEFGGIEYIMVEAKEVWVPDILLYNNWDVQDRIGGGKGTYKTQVTLMPNGINDWKSPAIFNSLCDIDVTYFPFDVQTCALKFGSWSLSSDQLTVYKEDMTTPSPNYLKNGEWELMNTTFTRNVLQYADNKYEDLTLTIEIGRNYFTYFVNLVLPCTLISAMIFLSFLLPPECGERISLGITVLLAMTVFQQLTYQIFPSFDIPLLGQYYIATGLEIGMALVATTIVLNFSFRKNTKMPRWMRKLLLFHLATVVRLRKTIEKSRPKPRRKSSQRRKANKTKLHSSQSEGEREEDRLVQELKNGPSIRHQSLDHGAFLFTINRARAESLKLNGDCRGATIAAAFKQPEESGTREEELQTGVLDENGEELNEEELALRQWEWNMAASVLDRMILWLSITIGVVTFLGVFLQAPRVQHLIF